MDREEIAAGVTAGIMKAVYLVCAVLAIGFVADKYVWPVVGEVGLVAIGTVIEAVKDHPKSVPVPAPVEAPKPVPSREDVAMAHLQAAVGCPANLGYMDCFKYRQGKAPLSWPEQATLTTKMWTEIGCDTPMDWAACDRWEKAKNKAEGWEDVK